MSIVIIMNAIYLQCAQPHNAFIWWALVEADRTYLGHWLPHLKRLDTIAAAERYVKKHQSLDYYLGSWVFEIWAEETIVGLIQVHSGNRTHQKAELAYWLGAAYRGKGYVTAACRILLALIFDTTSLQTIGIRCLPENTKSYAIPGRLGFSTEPQVIGKALLFTITRAEWMPQHDPQYWLSILEPLGDDI